MTIPMRRSAQQLPESACIEVLARNTSGILALNDPEQGVPYQVPLSYGYHDGRITFHGATAGHKLDLLARDGHASFTVIDQDEVVPKDYTTRYRSVTCTGTLSVVEDDDERFSELMFMAERFWPGHRQEAQAEIDRFFDRTCVLALKISDMVGKENHELAEMRRSGALS